MREAVRSQKSGVRRAVDRRRYTEYRRTQTPIGFCPRMLYAVYRLLLFALLPTSYFLLPFSAHAATHVTATYDLGANPRVMATVAGTPEYGLVFAQRNKPVTYNGIEYGPSEVKGYLNASGQLNDGAGNLWLDLIPNLGATPADSYYVVTFNIQGRVHAEIWVVPDVATVGAESVRQTQPPSATSSGFDLTTATGLLGLAHGGTNQSSWTAARCVRVNNAGSALESAAADCGTGGGSAPHASATVSGTVKTDSTVADPVVYLNTTADTLLAGKASSVHTHSENDVTNLTTDLAGKEATANKNQANGYAGLTASSKLNIAQGQEVWGIADLTTYNGASGSGTTAIQATITAPNSNDVLTWNGSNWINQAPSGGSSHDLLSATHSDTTPAAVSRGAIITGQGASPTKWASLAKGAQYCVVQAGALEIVCEPVRLDQAAAVTNTLGASNGGTGSAYVAFAGPSSAAKTFTLPNFNATMEYQANKNAASGYPGLDASSKLTASQGQEVWGAADLTDYAGTSGTGSTALKTTITSPASNDCLIWNGTNWVNSACPGGGGGITTLNTLTAATQTFATGTSGTDFGISSSTSTHTFNLPIASSSNTGKLSSTDWTTFNNKPSLVASGAEGNGPSKAGTASTAARSDHDHRSIHELTWFFPGTPATGVQNLTLTFPEVAVNYAILDMRVTVNTTSASSSTFNIQRCTASCTGTSPTFANIYSTNLTLSASTRTTTKAAAPDQNVTSLTAGDQFKANLITIGSSLADVTVTMTVKYDTTN